MASPSALVLPLLLQRPRQCAITCCGRLNTVGRRRRRNRRITRRALQAPSEAPFMVLLQSGCD